MHSLCPSTGIRPPELVWNMCEASEYACMHLCFMCAHISYSVPGSAHTTLYAPHRTGCCFASACIMQQNIRCLVACFIHRDGKAIVWPLFKNIQQSESVIDGSKSPPAIPNTPADSASGPLASVTAPPLPCVLSGVRPWPLRIRGVMPGPAPDGPRL